MCAHIDRMQTVVDSEEATLFLRVYNNSQVIRLSKILQFILLPQTYEALGAF